MCDNLSQIAQLDDQTVLASYESGAKSGTFQSEAQMEAGLIQILQAQGYEYIGVNTEIGLLANLRACIEALNAIKFTDAEWDRWFKSRLRYKNKLEKAHIIQDGSTADAFQFDNGVVKNICLLDKKDLQRNKLQVLNQYEANGGKQRYDVTILINGLPMCHIELKRRGVPVQEAYRQISRYEETSFMSGSGLFEYVQCFVISNGTETRYYGNSLRREAVQKRGAGFDKTNTWADVRNRPILDIEDFARTFLTKTALQNIIYKYAILDGDGRLLMLRPYQIAACEAIVNRAVLAFNNNKYGAASGGYIWHTTGSGKTLTSFAAAMRLCDCTDADKVFFVFDRNVLDSQTKTEYKKFLGDAGADMLGEANRTSDLEKYIQDSGRKIIITTIQKLDNLAKKRKFNNLKCAMVFDECHRSQFGDMHGRILNAFAKAITFGFTGTPIFRENAVSITASGLLKKTSGARGNGAVVNTTEDLFGPLLHSYVITDAIRDKTVLRFKIGYMNTAKIEDGVGDDEEVEGAAFEKTAMQPERIGAICDYIVSKFDQKTHRKQDLKFNSILACYDIEAATRYYMILKEKLKAVGRDDIKIAIIYTYGANDEILEYAGMSKEQFLGLAMQDYNAQFGTGFTLDDYKAYNDDISCRMKGRRLGAGVIMRDEMLDILIVADMYLTGFDSQYVNTLWVDKPLKYHALIQAFSRTNRTFGPNKPCGEIVCFRNLKSAVDTAISLFASADGRTGVLMCRTYEEYYNGYGDSNGKWNDGYAKLVDTLLSKFDYQHMTQDAVGEAEQAAFVKLFGQILVSRNLLNTFDEFVGNEILTQRQFDDYKGWYLHLHDTMGKGRAGLDNGDILDGLEFHVELVSEETVGIDGILERIRREAGKDMVLPGSVISADALAAIQSAVDASVAMRKKKRLLKLFLSQVNNGGDASGEAFLALAGEAYDKAVRNMIVDLKLRDEAVDFIKQCVDSGCVLETGSGLDAILPPVRRFGGGGHGAIREQAIEKIQAIVDEFEGLDIKA